MSRDLSRYFVVRKFNDGWLMGSQNGPETIFLTRDQLIEVGYLPQDTSDISKEQLIPTTKVITIPMGGSSDSSEEVRKIPPIDIPTHSRSDEIVVNIDELSKRLETLGRPMNRLSVPYTTIINPTDTVDARGILKVKRSSYPDRPPDYWSDN